MAITKRLRQRFVKAAERMAAVMTAIEKADPEANLYVQEDTFHLMSGETHEDIPGGRSKSRMDRILESVQIPRTDCGAW